MSFEHFNEFDDVRVIDGSQGIDFILDKFIKFRNAFEFLEVHLFNGEVFFGYDVFAQVNLAELTISYHAIEDIVIYLFHSYYILQRLKIQISISKYF